MAITKHQEREKRYYQIILFKDGILKAKNTFGFEESLTAFNLTKDELRFYLNEMLTEKTWAYNVAKKYDYYMVCDERYHEGTIKERIKKYKYKEILKQIK